jgi:hypothetical protein
MYASSESGNGTSVFVVDLSKLPRTAAGSLDLASYDRQNADFEDLPVVELVGLTDPRDALH